MKKEVVKDVYFCDYCHQEIKELTNVRGEMYEEGEVSFEPRLKGHYCEECVETAQRCWDELGIDSFLYDRYDDVTDKIIEEEKAGMSDYINIYLKKYHQ